MARRSVVPLLLVLACCSSVCTADLVQLIVVHRHGSRTRLDKNDTTLLESASTLTPQGMMQLYRAGNQVRTRYLRRPTCSVTSTCLQGDWQSYSQSSWYIQSSALDRTLVSSYSYSLGVLSPAWAGLAVSNHLPLAEDWVIRPFGEAKCPTFLNNLQAFYNTSFFMDKSKELAGTLQELTTAMGKNVTLQDMWNIFDEYNVQYTYGAGTLAGGAPLPAISNETWQQVQAAANWLEWNRYGNRTQAQSLCGGPLLAKIIQSIEAGAGALTAVPPAVSVGPRLIGYSGHYATQLCLLAAINLNPPDGQKDPNAWIQHIPAYGAVLAVEVSNEASGLRIKVLLQDGQDAPYRAIVLPCAPAGGDGSCTYADFKNMTTGSTFSDVGEWCTACANNTMTYCAAAKYSALVAANQTMQCANTGSKITTTWLPILLISYAVTALVLLQ
eukprot:SM000454S16466  [mRNA]  locus=s454:18761:22420:+ [translate_table: standard]